MKRILLLLGFGLVLAVALAISGAVARDDVRNVGLVNALLSDDGATVSILVPFDGGCARRTHDPYYEIEGGTLAIWVEKQVGEFSCAAGCIDEPCTEMVTLRLDEAIDPSTPIVFRNPGPGIMSGVITVLIGLAAASAVVAFLWPALTTTGWRSSRHEANSE
ncbi:MAG: hypothetical protein GY724_27645 [Actinomycetia bacterium]|nr:hypothetical protein [Actinomycetes bacterium]